MPKVPPRFVTTAQVEVMCSKSQEQYWFRSCYLLLRRRPPKSLTPIVEAHGRDERSSKNASGGYSLKETGNHFRLHHSRVSCIVKQQRLRPDPMCCRVCCCTRKMDTKSKHCGAERCVQFGIIHHGKKRHVHKRIDACLDDGCLFYPDDEPVRSRSDQLMKPDHASAKLQP